MLCVLDKRIIIIGKIEIIPFTSKNCPLLAFEAH